MQKDMRFKNIQSDESFYGKGQNGRFRMSRACRTSCPKKLKRIVNLKKKSGRDLKQNEQYEVFYELEMPLSLILADMESWV